MRGKEEAGLIISAVLALTDGREGTRVLIRGYTPRFFKLSKCSEPTAMREGRFLVTRVVIVHSSFKIATDGTEGVSKVDHRRACEI